MFLKTNLLKKSTRNLIYGQVRQNDTAAVWKIIGQLLYSSIIMISITNFSPLIMISDNMKDHQSWLSLVHLMTCRLIGNKPLPLSMVNFINEIIRNTSKWKSKGF